MQVEHGRLRTEAVLPCGSHPVDSHSFIDVFDSILDRAHVGICQCVAVSEVQGDARPCSVSLHKQTLSGTLQVSACCTSQILSGFKLCSTQHSTETDFNSKVKLDIFTAGA